jgi:hypothetical protein
MSSLDFDTDSDADAEAAMSLLERRWFAALAATRVMQTECETLREVVHLAEASWRRARAKLAVLERMRDELGDALAAADARHDVGPDERMVDPGDRPVMSAA